MFTGVQTAFLDEEGRLNLPRSVSNGLDKEYRDRQLFVTSLDGESVKVFPLREWEVVEARLSDPSPEGNEPDGVLKDKILFQANRFGAEETLDDQGRLQVPRVLQKSAGMKDEVVMLWENNHIRVVSQSRLEFAAELLCPPEIVEVTFDFQRLINETSLRPEVVFGLTGRQFEELIAELWKLFGYDVELTKRTHDCGHDIVAVRGGEAALRFLIECKRYKPSQKVGISLIRALYGVTEHEGATKGILATTSSFTHPASEFLQDHRWVLEGRDYGGVLSWLTAVRQQDGSSLWVRRSSDEPEPD